MSRILVLGIGNILLQDEGVGVRVVEYLLARYAFADNVQMLDGGTIGLELLFYIEGVDKLIVIDAVDAAQPPGGIVCLVDDEIPALLGKKLSPHQVGLADLLVVARMRDIIPSQVVLIGVQPAMIDTGLELSPIISAKVPEMAQMILDQIRAWGCTPAHIALDD